MELSCGLDSNHIPKIGNYHICFKVIWILQLWLYRDTLFFGLIKTVVFHSLRDKKN